MFDHLGQESWAWSEADRRLADAMAGYWVNFARTGDPNGPGLPDWPAFGADANVQALGERIRTLKAPVDPQLRVFDTVYDALRGPHSGRRNELRALNVCW